MTVEGGFNGRANKLVDSCYSFWQGASFQLLREVSRQAGERLAPLFSKAALEKYVLCACQRESGGLRDKPGKQPDYYHTCYALSGLAAT